MLGVISLEYENSVMLSILNQATDDIRHQRGIVF